MVDPTPDRTTAPPADDQPAGPEDPGASAVARDATRELCVVIPTFNERDNVQPLLDSLESALSGMSWEAIFVDDDSPDGTAEEVLRIARERPNVRCLQRIGRRGLSTACIEGMYASAAPYIAVMDADLQHDAGILPLMLDTLKRDQLDIVVGSRYAEGGGTGDWEPKRARLGRFANRIGELVLRARLKDSMSGYFVLRRPFIDKTVRRMSGRGFKILLDIFMSAEAPVRFAEIPYRMRSRTRGSSKLDANVLWEFFALVADKLIGHIVPLRFIMFATVGALGAVLHLTVLGTMTQVLQFAFVTGQSVATVAAMTVNFYLNNLFTYRDRRLRGWRAVRGLASFYIVCGLGAAINVVLAGFLFDSGIVWWLSGLIGALVGSVWNFAVSSVLTWKSQVEPPNPVVEAGKG